MHHLLMEWSIWTSAGMSGNVHTMLDFLILGAVVFAKVLLSRIVRKGHA